MKGKKKLFLGKLLKVTISIIKLCSWSSLKTILMFSNGKKNSLCEKYHLIDDNKLFTVWISVAEPHHFYAAPAPS
jgi:hypothetical protein